MRFPVVATFIYFEITLPSPECTVTNNNCFHSYLTQPSFYNITIFLTVNIFCGLTCYLQKTVILTYAHTSLNLT